MARPSIFSKLVLPLVALLALWFVLYTGGRKYSDPGELAELVQSSLLQQEEQCYKLLEKNDIATAIKGDQTALIKQLDGKRFELLVYRNDSLLFWSSNKAIPTFKVSSLDAGSNFVKLKNGWYDIMRIDQPGGLVVLGLIPVKRDYNIENQYLENTFALGLNEDLGFEVQPGKSQSGFQVYDSQDNALFVLIHDHLAEVRGSKLFYYLAASLFVLVLFLLVVLVADGIGKRTNQWLGLGLLIISLIALRALGAWVMFPDFSDMTLFQPSVYASSLLAPSLGDLLINLLMLSLVVGFFFLRVRFRKVKRPLLAYLLILVFAVLIATLIVELIKSLIIDSIISFDITNFMSLDTYSVVGMLCLAILFLNFYVLIYRAVSISPFKIKDKKLLLVLAGSFALFIGIRLFLGEPQIMFGLFTLVFIAFLHLLRWRGHNLFSYTNVILSAALLAMVSAYYFNQYNEEKEEERIKQEAKALAEDRDYIAEYAFVDVAERIKADQFVKSFFDKPYISRSEIDSRLNYLYFGGYLSKYELDIYTFRKDGSTYKSSEPLSLSFFQDKVKQGSPSDQGQLHFVPGTDGNYSYISILPIDYQTDSIGLMVFQLTPKRLQDTKVYPALLLEANVAEYESNDDDLWYAVYVNDQLIRQHGNYAYSYYRSIGGELQNGEFQIVDEGRNEHIIHRISDDKVVIVSERRRSLLNGISTFSYMLCIYLLLILLLFLVVYLIRRYRQQGMGSFRGMSFRNRINFSMLAIIVLSFVVIGIITIFYFTRQYEQYHYDRLLRKERSVLSAIEYDVQLNDSLNLKPLVNRTDLLAGLSVDVVSLSDIHSMDINIYDLSGDLVTSSQPGIFNKGLISRKMDPTAYHKVSKENQVQYVQEERIGCLTYLSVYVPVKNAKANTIAYLHMPYFAQAQNLRQEISSFMVALVNVYVLLLVAAGLVAFLISNSITRSLTNISRKLSMVKLGKKNEPIVWERRDEIGLLVDEYNRMIVELDESAQILAKSERETAWREMAKQIAHEIKNPLTPMKLSIQYLQRALNEDDPEAPQLAKRVTNTLIEQIENLSEIATAFSSFAKMPKAKNEEINLNDLLEGVVNLFQEEPNAEVLYTSDSQQASIYADKNQLISVFNNLVKNAIQAIPEDQQGTIEVSLKPEGQHFMVAVKDDGSGIDDETKDKVFVPNFTTKSSGTGLGLAIAKQIIENAGGEISFESELGRGTTFYVRLPRNKG